MKKLAVVLLSGGLDSTTVLAEAIKENDEVHALSVYYGQRHDREIASASNVASWYGVPWTQVSIPGYGEVASASSLTNRDKDVPIDRIAEEMSAAIPSTYVPMRNTLFLTLASAHLESWVMDLLGKGSSPLQIEGAIYIGANALDYAGYPDCRPEFYEAMEQAISVGSTLGNLWRFKIEAPIIHLSKQQIVDRGTFLQAPLFLTWSCYIGGAKPCGVCDACLLRAEGFRLAGVPDRT